jgi:hypothetical protein
MTPEYRIETEKRIRLYMKHNKIKKVLNIKCEETFSDTGEDVNVWNVKTTEGAWWVVEGENAPMNLYSQNEVYLSADEAYSFHLGITKRLQNRYNDEFKHIIDELPLDIENVKGISRRLNLAAKQLSEAVEPEQFQAVGLTCRESLIELGKELLRRNKDLSQVENLKKADFKGIANAFIDLYIPGEKNADLRNYSRKLVDSSWSYCSQIVHSPNRTHPDIKIAILFAASTVSLFQNLFLKHIGYDSELNCSKCHSKDLEYIPTGNNKDFILLCNACGHDEVLVSADAKENNEA